MTLSDDIDIIVELVGGDKGLPLELAKKSLKNRTKMDKTRKNSPLVKVKDAILIRTDKLSKRGVLNKMSKYIENLN